MKKLFTFLFVILATVSVWSQDFSYEGINYTILNDNAQTCMTKAGSESSPGNDVNGDVVIPQMVSYENKSYSVVSIGNYSFAHTNIDSMILPNSIIEIGHDAFNGSEIISIEFNDGLKIINNDAFIDCTNLQSVTLPNTLNSLGDRAFMNCISLENIQLSNALKLLSNYVFAGCNALKSIKLPDSITDMGHDGGGGHCFSNCTNLNSVELSKNLEYIGWQVFQGCTSLVSIDIPDSVTVIQYAVFAGCTSLKNVRLSNSITDFAGSLFEGCTSLEYIEIPSSVRFMNGHMFSGCTSLKTVKLLPQLSSLGTNLFKDCNNLNDLYLWSTTPPSCDLSTFMNVSLAGVILHVPIGTKKIYEDADTWKNFSEIIDDVEIPATRLYLSSTTLSLKENQSYKLSAYIEPTYTTDILKWESSDDNIATVSANGIVTAHLEGEVLITVSCGSLSSTCEVRVLPIVPEVGNTFEYKNLWYSVLDISNNYVSVNRYSEVSEDLTIPDTVEFLGETFYVTQIGSGAFNGCKNLKSIKTPNCLTTIWNNAFYNCQNLAELEFGSSLNEIRDSAFSGCTEITSIKSFASNPPSLSPSAFPLSVYETAKVTVHEQALKTYVRDDMWGRFRNYLTITSGASLSHYEVEMAGDEVFQLGLFNTDDEVEWSSSNTDIAYVNDCGLIVAMGATGVTQVTAKINGETLNCRVIVSTPSRGERINQQSSKRISSSTDIQDIDPTEIKIESVNWDKKMLNVRLFPYGASTVMNWTSSDSSIAKVENGLITVYESGVVDFEVETENGLEESIEVDTKGIDNSGLDSILSNSDIAPTNVYDISGRMLYRNASLKQIRNIEKGLYIINGKKVLVK
ncbi:MAG: leucine-rich repeat protein [Muribaculaceae bacterium]|nr:leucine-rich repeat protein [Muribaculaceae bacterium]